VSVSPEEHAQVREFAREQAALAAEYRMRVRILERDNRRLSRRLNRVYRSWTWRIGRVVLFPYYGVAWLLNRVRGQRNNL
jgi:hypothetical protein